MLINICTVKYELRGMNSECEATLNDCNNLYIFLGQLTIN